MPTIPDQDPSWSAFRPTSPVPLIFSDSRLGPDDRPCPAVLFPDDPLSRERLRLLGALDGIVRAEYGKTLDAQRDAFARIILDAYGEWVAAGKPPFPQ